MNRLAKLAAEMKTDTLTAIAEGLVTKLKTLPPHDLERDAATLTLQLVTDELAKRAKEASE